MKLPESTSLLVISDAPYSTGEPVSNKSIKALLDPVVMPKEPPVYSTPADVQDIRLYLNGVANAIKATEGKTIGQCGIPFLHAHLGATMSIVVLMNAITKLEQRVAELEQNPVRN